MPGWRGPALVNGEAGIVVVAPRGRLMLVVRVAFEGGRIVELEGLADPDSIRQLEIAALDP